MRYKTEEQLKWLGNEASISNRAIKIKFLEEGGEEVYGKNFFEEGFFNSPADPFFITMSGMSGRDTTYLKVHDIHRSVAVCRCSIPDLAPIIVPPAFHPATGDQGAGVSVSSENRHHATCQALNLQSIVNRLLPKWFLLRKH